MANGLLGQIANPQAPSVLSSLNQAAPVFQNIRQQEEQGEIRQLQGRVQQAQLAGRAPEAQDIERLGMIAPNVMAGMANAFGIPVGEQARVLGFAKDIRTANRLAKFDPDAAYRYIAQRRDELASFGVNTSKTDQLLLEFEQDPDFAIANLQAMDASLMEAGLLARPEEKFIKTEGGQSFFNIGGGRTVARDIEGFDSAGADQSKERSQILKETRSDITKGLNSLEKESDTITTNFRKIKNLSEGIRKGNRQSVGQALVALVKIGDPTSTVRDTEMVAALNNQTPTAAIAALFSDKQVDAEVSQSIINKLDPLNPTAINIDDLLSTANALVSANAPKLKNRFSQLQERGGILTDFGREAIFSPKRLKSFNDLESLISETGAQSGPPTVTTQAQFDALPSGASFIEDGQTLIKE